MWNQGPQSIPSQFSVATWSRLISHSQIVKFGTESDKLLLKEPTNRNKAVVAGSTRNRQPKRKNVKHPTRQEKRRAAKATGGSAGVAAGFVCAL